MAIRCGVGHILFRGRHPTFTPDDRPFVVDKDLTPDVNFTFIDVIPGIVKPGEYHAFGQLIDEANIWLTKNRGWEVINCETVLLFFKASDNGSLHLAPEDTCFPLDGDAHNSLMGLRLWLKRYQEDEEEELPAKAQVLKYAEFTPRHDEEDDSCRFKKLHMVVERINKEIQGSKVDPLLGEIITIETLYFPATSNWRLEDETKVQLFPTRCISVIRLFYTRAEQPPAKYPVIGIRDFVPRHISGGSLFKKPTFEPLSDVISRASDWLSANPEADFRNAQCLEVKMKIMGRVDSRVMSHSADRGDYIRIFRVSYVTTEEAAESLKAKDVKGHKASREASKDGHLSAGESSSSQSNSGDHQMEPSADTADRSKVAPIYMASIIFTPAGPEATVQEIRRKIHEWVLDATKEVINADPDSGKMHRPRLLSAETVEIFSKDFSEDELKSETENTFKFNRIGTMNSFLFMAFRLYFDVGFFGKQKRSKSISPSTISVAARTFGPFNHQSCSVS